MLLVPARIVEHDFLFYFVMFTFADNDVHP